MKTLPLLALAVASGLAAPACLAAPAWAAPLYGITDINVPGAASGTTTPFAINNSGEVAGTYEDPAVGFRVFSLTGSSYATVDPANAVNGSSFVSLNNAGQIVGFANTATPPSFGYYYLASGGSISEFPPPGAKVPAGAAFSWYNDKGAIAGDVGTSGFISKGGVVTKINPPTSTQTTINAINNSADVVGQYDPLVPPSPTANQSAFLYAGGVYTTLAPPGSTFTEATGINDLGEVVGYFDEAPITGANGIQVTPIVGFTYQNGIYTDYSVPGAVETELFGINDSGKVVGYESDESGDANGFEASTVPEPASIILVCSGLLGLGLIRMRARPVAAV